MTLFSSSLGTRRKSIAVVQPNKSTTLETNPKKKRSHSIAPGELTTLAKLRRIVAPRKSILKSAPPADDEQASTDLTASGTHDFTTEIHDNSSRKSLSRRVSFAPHAYIRMFGSKEPKTGGNSSPVASALTTSSSSNKENDPRPRRQSTTGEVVDNQDADYGGDEASMSMSLDEDDIIPGDLLAQSDDTTDDDGFEDMDMTEAIPAHIRKRSLSTARRSSLVPRRSLYFNASHDSEGDEDGEATMEFTVPLAQPLRKPGPPDPTWLALRAVTHSGNTIHEPELPSDDDAESEHMQLDDAVRRLEAARQSMGIVNTGEGVGVEESFTNTEDSLDESIDSCDVGDRTINLTGLLHRSSRQSVGSAMESTAVYGIGNIVLQKPTSGTSTQKLAMQSSYVPEVITSQTTPEVHDTGLQSSTLLSRIPSASSTGEHEQLPPSTTSLHSSSSTFATERAGVSSRLESFKPSSTSRSPGKASSAIPLSVFTAPPSPVRKKRTAADEGSHPSPAKKQAMDAPILTPVTASLSKTVLSPSKKANVSTANASRRPSGYFASRKSLFGVDVGAADENSSQGSKTTAVTQSHKQTGRSPPVSPSNESDMTADEEERRNKAADPQSNHSRSPSPGVGDLEQRVRFTHLGEDANVNLVNLTEHWRSGVEDQSASEPDGPFISIEQFFLMTGINFMDDLTCPRRSTIHPSQLETRQQTSRSEPIPMSEYVTAMTVEIPQLELYSWVAKDLQGWIEHSKLIYRQAEEEVAKVTPGLFREYSQANEIGRAELLHQLKLIKANNHGLAKAKWYDWKLIWVDNLSATAEKGYSDLEADAKALEQITRRAQNVVPALRDEYAEAMRELELEQAAVADMENSDQEYLNELKATIAEQSAELEVFRADVSEGHAKLERLNEKLAEVEAAKREAQEGITETRRLLNVQKNSTRAEVFRLKDELEGLQSLHLWRATKIHPDSLDFVYGSRYTISIPCLKFRPIPDQITISRTESLSTREKERFPELSDIILETARRRVTCIMVDISARQVLQVLGDFWSSCAQLRKQLTFLSIKYPLSLDVQGKDVLSGFKAIVTVLLNKANTKALITFTFDADTLSKWPVTIAALKCDVEIVYGSLQRQLVLDAVMDRLQQASPTDSHGCLLDACIEATERFGQ